MATPQPEPFAAQEAAGVGEQDGTDNAEGEEAHGVLGEHAEAERGTDREPPARVASLQQPNNEVRGEDPTEIVEGDVRHERAAADTKRNGSESSENLRASGAAELTRHQTSKDNRDGLHKPGEKTEARERGAEEQQRESREEWRDWRIGNVAPGEVAGVVEEREFVAIEAVAIAGKEVEKQSGKCDGEKRDEIAAPEGVRWSGKARGGRKSDGARIELWRTN